MGRSRGTIIPKYPSIPSVIPRNRTLNDDRIFVVDKIRHFDICHEMLA